jgi:8-oxo-dGTP pyrophosphatase MutT (NUDIX family)
MLFHIKRTLFFDKKRTPNMPTKVNNRTTLHRGRVFKLVRENVTLANGVTVDLDMIRHPGASAMIPMADKNTVILIKQYRHAVGEFIWEIPAGTLDPGETPFECAKRELIEETGFSANVWQKMGEITPVPGYSDERIHIFLAASLVRAKQNLDRDEMLNVHSVSVDDAIEMIHQGKIQDGKTIAGLFMATHWLKEKRWGLI